MTFVFFGSLNSSHILSAKHPSGYCVCVLRSLNKPAVQEEYWPPDRAASCGDSLAWGLCPSLQGTASPFPGGKSLWLKYRGPSGSLYSTDDESKLCPLNHPHSPSRSHEHDDAPGGCLTAFYVQSFSTFHRVPLYHTVPKHRAVWLGGLRR